MTALRGSVSSVPVGEARRRDAGTDPARVPPEVRGVRDLLAAVVAAIGGAERQGQVAMAEAVHSAIGGREHLAVQAGTGTGKSFAYLVPAVRHAITARTAIVVSTATIALQRQLIEHDLPRMADALKPLLSREPVSAILKGRRNYLCLYRLHAGGPDDQDQTLFDARSVSAVGRQVQRLHKWAETTETGDRDELVPGVDDRAWRQVAVSANECLGARCPLRADCFAERARDEAAAADIVVTNHALLAIDAMEDFQVLPDHDVVIIDEAHDLVDRVTSVASGELSAPGVDAAARRCGRLLGDNTDRDKKDRNTDGANGQESPVVRNLKDAGDALALILGDTPGGRIDFLPEALGMSLAAVRDAAHECATELRMALKRDEDDAERLGIGRAALTATEEVHDTAARLLRGFGPDIAARPEVVWLDRPFIEESRRPPTLRVAPLDVGELLAERLFGRRTVVLTSATLALGGSFEPLARQWGLPELAAPAGEPPTVKPAVKQVPNGCADAADAEQQVTQAADRATGTGPEERAADSGAEPAKDHPLTWSGLDVGSPFDHPRSGILYVARHLPPPRRDGLPDEYLNEMCELITAAGGRTLGLFSSMRAARQATDELRDRISHPLLCQGEDATAQLVRQFAADEATCLFGTLSLWQGVDVPGSALQLVVIDRIPFPRPDDPLASARQRAVAGRGGNGFMAVAATSAALLLAQGAGRLLRRMTDRGVVAVLDPRLVTARYGSFLRASLPPFWATTDPEVVRGALRRLASCS